MKAENVTEQILEYVQSHKISVCQMSRDLGIPKERLQPGKSHKNFTASEFLEICVYLGIRPEKFRQRGMHV